jgi:hypothetical protein
MRERQERKLVVPDRLIREPPVLRLARLHRCEPDLISTRPFCERRRRGRRFFRARQLDLA